jgi:hypothetical protein
MKKIKILITSILFGGAAFSQPIGNPPANNTNARAAAAWYRGGNNIGGTNPVGANIFGTMWNSPIYTHTNGINRMIVNGDKTPTLNGFNVNTSGYVGIGNPNYSPLVGGGPMWSTQGPFSLLHLNGDGGGQENGYRPWMQTGITFTEGFDLSYVGNRVVDGVGDRNEFTMAWSNDPTSTQFGPDDMVFRFLSGRAPGAAGSTINNNFSVPNDLDGRHIARFTGSGEFGLGNTFGLVQSGVGYVRPQSLLHMSLFQSDQVWMQITNQLGTGQTIDDGLRFGINGGGNSLAYLNWQENTPFVIQTDWDATPGGINNSERMRISSIGSNGVPKPANFIDDNVTRVAISHRGNTPITAPRSLLHLGYNTGNGTIGNFIADGWRDWMDIGTFTNNGTDNIYVGLKEEGVDRFDAVINWGDNQVAGNTPNGPDNLRFIFTSTNTALPPGEGDPVSQSNNGLETARFVPTKASTLPNSNYGMLGIGDWTTAFNIIPTNVIDAKLDIDGDLRIRTVTPDNTLTQILAIDQTDHNRVHWIDATNLTPNVTSDNGIFVNTAGVVQLGVPCLDVNGNINTVGILATQFTEDRVIANRDFNFWIGSLDTETGGVGFGGQPASTAFCNTGNTVEISANMKSTKYGNANASGLRLTQLTSASPTLANGTNGVDNTRVLTVDQDGDVVLVDAVGVSLGNQCSQTQNPLISSHEIPLNDFNFIFSGQGATRNNVGIGTTCNPIAKLEVRRTNVSSGLSNTNGLIVENSDDALTNQVGIQSNVTGNSQTAYGVITLVSGSATTNFGANFAAQGNGITQDNYGTWSSAQNASDLNVAYSASASGTGNSNNYGFQSFTYATGIPTTGFNYGLGSQVTGGARNYGVWQQVYGSSLVNYGLYATATDASFNYGVFTSAPTTGSSRAGFFVGIAESTSGGILTSDQMFKKDVENIKEATSVLRKLKPHTYKMDVTGFPQFNFQDRLQYGFIAQEVGEVLPDLVYDSYMPSELDSLGNEIHPAVSYKSLNYNALIPITVQAVNEMYEKIDKSTLSDQNVKTNVETLTNALDKVKQMRGVSYEWSSSAQNDMNLDSLQHIGFIAQEIAAIEPLLTFVDDSSLVHVNYDRVVPLLVESVKELDDKILAKDSIIENLEIRLAYLESCIRNANICEEGNRAINQNPATETNYRSVELTNNNSIILDQNSPNPFAENTIINYNIPTDVVEAKLMFYDLNGRIIKELIIEERGESKLTVYGTNLKTGVYTYSLIADGELIATKKMVKK